MVGCAASLRTPWSPKSGNARVSATMAAERFDSAPPLVKLAAVLGGNPNLAANHARVCRSISFAAGEVRHVANCGLCMATIVSATIDGNVTLGLNRPR